MILTKCPECGHEVSERAQVCPKCGHPMPDKEPRRWLGDRLLRARPSIRKQNEDVEPKDTGCLFGRLEIILFLLLSGLLRWLCIPRY
jgi:hypothetical protein